MIEFDQRCYSFMGKIAGYFTVTIVGTIFRNT